MDRSTTAAALLALAGCASLGLAGCPADDGSSTADPAPTNGAVDPSKLPEIEYGPDGMPLLPESLVPPQYRTKKPPTGEPELVSLLGAKLHATPTDDPKKLAEMEANVGKAIQAMATNPGKIDNVIWLGRRLGYLWRMHEAIEVYTEGLAEHPDEARFLRHRGHRYISIREFDNAIADLERAATLVEGKPQRIEPDGMPNDRDLPLTTTAGNIYYHLALAHYLEGDFEAAVGAWTKCLEHGRGLDDNIVSSTDWMYMALRRLGREEEAAELLEPIRDDMDIIENHSYHARCLMYKGLKNPGELLDPDGASPLDFATQGYGVGNWYLYNGDEETAKKIFEKVVEGGYWPAFGYIAAEVELARMKGRR